VAARTIILWDLARGEGRAVLLGHGGPVNDVLLAGRWLVSGGADGTVRL
jgi:hypothetical protein